MAKSRRKRERKRGSRARSGQTPRTRVAEAVSEFDRAVAEVERRVREAHAPETSPERIAQILVEDFEGLTSPVGFALTLADQDPERARAVLAELERLEPDSPCTLTFAAEVARNVDGDGERSAELLDQVLESDLGLAAMGPLAMHLLNGDLVVPALQAAEQCLMEDPDDETGQEVLAAGLEQFHARAQAGKRLGRDEREALERFADRGAIYRLREQIVEFVDGRPDLEQLTATTVREWLGELDAAGLISLDELDPAGGEELSERHEGLLRLAIERAWLRELDDEGDDDAPFEPEPQPELEDSTAPMALLATDPATTLDIADLARTWVGTCTYGLWQISSAQPSPGLWLTDIVSGIRRYAAVPPEQLEQASRWGVLLGALVALDGVWRTSGAVVYLRPAEGDAAAELAHRATRDLAQALTGKRLRRADPWGGRAVPHGVLADASDPADPLLADMISKVIGILLPTIAADTWRRRAAGPKLTNTDGHHLKLITARIAVQDAQSAARRLATEDDFRAEDDGELTWWGRELSPAERESALAQIREQFGDEETTEADDERPRWLRGRLKRAGGGFDIEVNSEERLAMLLERLSELGIEPSVHRRSAIEPAQDLPPIQLGGPMPFGASQPAIDAWLEAWPGERVPALGGLTPRVAARKKDRRPLLEAVLREFEHDAHLLRSDGRPAPDIGRLREALGMEVWWAERPARH